MKKILFYATFLFAFMACTKQTEHTEDDNPDNPSIDGVSTKKVDLIRLQTFKFGQGADTAGNYIANYGFTLKDETQAWFVATNNLELQKYTIKYVGNAPLLSPDSLIWNSYEAMMFPINKELKGKTLFEIYQAGTEKVVKRIAASPDSCKIMASFSVFGNRFVTPAQIRSAFHYYMTEKQAPAIRYYNTQDY